MYHTIHIEERNKPAVALVNQAFAQDARSSASSKGMPGLRVVSETVPCESRIMEETEAGISAAMDNIVAALTKRLTAEERSPKPKEVEKLPRIVFKGNLEEVNQFFYKRGWGDGLPIIPPTEEAVAEMLTGTDLPADRVVDKIIPRLGKATVEKIAINAVMAGALPTYMPLLIAGVQALTVAGSSSLISTGSWAPFWIINGPIRRDLNIRSGVGVFSPGDLPNTVIGRTMGLILKNIGGIRKGIEDMGTLGDPMRYSLVTAENEEESPWEPLHVERGFNKEDSAITVSFPNNFGQTNFYGSDDKGILNAIIYNIIPGRKGSFSLVMIPDHAKVLASKGWTKKEVKAFISEYARAPAYHHQEYYGGQQAVVVDPAIIKEWLPANPMDSMRILRSPDWITVVVAGGSGSWIGLLAGGGGARISDVGWVTKKVELPANWDKLVAKYKDIVPTYLLY